MKSQKNIVVEAYRSRLMKNNDWLLIFMHYYLIGNTWRKRKKTNAQQSSKKWKHLSFFWTPPVFQLPQLTNLRFLECHQKSNEKVDQQISPNVQCRPRRQAAEVAGAKLRQMANWFTFAIKYIFSHGNYITFTFTYILLQIILKII